MPVINKKGEKLGVMQVLNKKGGPFGRIDEKRLRAFTAQASIAIENAQLFKEVLNARNYNESILKSLSNGVITLDGERRIIKVNEAAARILKLREDTAIGMSARDAFSGANDWIIAGIVKVSRTGEADFALDTDIRVEGGGAVSVNLTIVPLVNIKEEPIGFMLILEDISSEKRVKTTMARYMTKEVMDKLIEEGESVLGGSTREVTVLFSDIRSFTSISEQLGAEETVSMLNEYFSDMIEVILDHGGILDKYIGDAIMALFGTPFKTDDDADNAVIVGIKMMEALSALNERRRDAGKELIVIGVGISTGEVVAGNIGSPKRMDYTVIGDSVNLASRLEGANKYYGSRILVSEFTVERMNSTHCIRHLDLIRVKGKNEPVAVFEVLDYHTEETFPRLAEVLSAFEQGVKNYQNRAWGQALSCFERALEYNPHDGPSRLYLERCRHCLESPPADSWDGVWTMQQK